MSKLLRGMIAAAVVGLLMLGGSSRLTRAQTQGDEIYVVTMNPTELHGFHFDAGTNAFVEDSLDPSGSGPALHVGVDSSALAVTNRFFLITDNLTDVALSIVDAATGVQLPRPRTSAAEGSTVVTSRDGLFSFETSSGPGISVPPVMSVVDLRPSSPTLGQEIKTLQLPALPTTTSAASFVSALDASGRLFVALRETGGSTQDRIHTIDVSNPLAPAVLSSTTLARSSRATALHVVTIAGTEYLMVARQNLEMYQVGADGSVTFVQSLGTTNSQFGSRTVHDVVDVSTPNGDRAIEVTDALQADGASGAEELVVVDLTPGTSSPFSGSVLATTTLPTIATSDVDYLALSSDGATLFVLNQGVDSSLPGGPQAGQILAYNTTAVLAGNATAMASRTVDGTAGTFATAGAMVVRPPVAPAGTVSIGSVLVDGNAGAVLTNDTPHALTITGSGFSGVQHVFVGPVDYPVTPTSDTSITVIVNPLTEPAATASILATGSGGSARASLTVANSPTYLPGHVVYAAAFGGNRIAVMNAATKTEVSSTFATGQGPVNPIVSPDGKLLFVPDFRGNDLAVHSLVDDATQGVVAGQQIATIPIGVSPFAAVIDAHRLRLYVSTSPETIAIIGIDPNDAATYLKVINTIGSEGGNIYRALALTPDGQYLYAAGAHEPYLTIVNVSTDFPTPNDVTLVTLNLNEPAGRTDGLAVSPDGNHLYFMTQSDQALRIYDISNRTAPTPTTAVGLPDIPQTAITPGCGLPAGDQRTIQAGPDGRFVYVASRARGCLDIFDPTKSQFVASIPTGAFSIDPVVTSDSQFVFVSVEQSDSIATIDERATVNGAPNTNLHKVIAITQGGQGTTGAAISPGLATPPGSDVAVQPLSGVSLTFDSVTSGGNTTVTSGNASQLTLPPQFEIAGTPVYFDVKTTATFTGNVTVCFPYDPTTSNPQLLHEDNGTFVDVTTSVDPSTHTICGTVSHFSQFVVAQFRPPAITGLSEIIGHPGAGDRGLTPVTFVVSVTGGCDPDVSSKITAIADADSDSGGDPDRSRRPEWQITGPLTALMQVEGNSGHDSTYDITVQSTDKCGNTSIRTFTVTLRRGGGNNR